jgi:hypothetical protein
MIRKFPLHQLVDLDCKGQGHMKVVMIHDKPSDDNTPTYQIAQVHVKI